MPTELTPKWKPIPLPPDCTPAGGVLFDPVVSSQLAHIVAGGPRGISVFKITGVRKLVYTVKAQVEIAGFAVSEGYLFVQDGPVLFKRDLISGDCVAGMNLVTKKPWVNPSPTAPVAQPPAQLYDLPPASAALQSSLLAARAAQGQRAGEGTLRAAADEALTNALAAAATMVFSAPAIRTLQIDSQPLGQIFVLCLDGTVNSLDEGLTHVSTYRPNVEPLRAELALSEVPQPNGTVLCHLHYVTKTGAIASVDGMKNPMVLLKAWESVGTPVEAKVLPLRFQDGLLWGGGVLGADFFATLPDPDRPLMLKVPAPAPASGWRSYEFNSVEKLVLVSNGTEARLVSYDSLAKVRDRWQLRTSSIRGSSIFWPLFESHPTPAMPRLTLEVDLAKPAAGPLTFRVLLANTVDSPNPAQASSYPPPVKVLGTGTFAAGDFDTLAAIDSFVGRPFVIQEVLYGVIWGQKTPDSPEKGFVLAAFGLNAVHTEVLPQAQATLAELQTLAQPIRLRVMRTDKWGRPGSERWQPPAPVRATRLTLALASRNLDVGTDADGIVELDSSLTGQEIGVADWSVRGWRANVSCDRTRLQTGQINVVEVRTWEF